MKWRRWAHRMLDPNQTIFYMNFEADRGLLEAYGLDDPIVEVELTENARGQYWGWIPTGEKEVEMVQPHEGMFSMQFPYGLKAEVKHGNGRIIRLTVVELAHK